MSVNDQTGPSAAAAAEPSRLRGRRTLSWASLLLVISVWVLLPAFVDVLVLDAAGEVRFSAQEDATALVVGKSVGAAIVIAVVTGLRWWPEVLRERLRTRRWVWVIPLGFLATSAATVDYTRLAAAGALLSLSLLAGTLLLAMSEELMFRGVVLTFLRDRHREIVAAVGSSALFGLSHFLAGPLQVAMSALFGYLLYLSRRVAGGLLVPVAVHAAWDFSVFSGLTTMNPATESSTGLILALLTFAGCILAAAGHRRLEPTRTPEPVG